jgi:hypothetical protein
MVTTYLEVQHHLLEALELLPKTVSRVKAAPHHVDLSSTNRKIKAQVISEKHHEK